MQPITVYCVQPYWTNGRKFVRGELRQFETEAEAMKVGARLGRVNAGVIVYALDGDPEFDVWDEPRVLARYGSMPTIERMAA